MYVVSFFYRTWKIPYIPHTPTLYRPIPYTENPVPYIIYGTVHYVRYRTSWPAFHISQDGGQHFKFSYPPIQYLRPPTPLIKQHKPVNHKTPCRCKKDGATTAGSRWCRPSSWSWRPSSRSWKEFFEQDDNTLNLVLRPIQNTSSIEKVRHYKINWHINQLKSRKPYM